MATDGWLGFVALTVSTWGLYGILLHAGQMQMADPVSGRYKAFLFVGIAYMLTAVLAPAALLWAKGAGFAVTPMGAVWSLAAGTVGAAGAFGVLLAFGAGGTPPVVMSLVFAGAPIVNAVVGLTLANQWSKVSWPFLLGILLAATGGYLVVRFKPGPGHAPPPVSVPDDAALPASPHG